MDGEKHPLRVMLEAHWMFYKQYDLQAREAAERAASHKHEYEELLPHVLAAETPLFTTRAAEQPALFETGGWDAPRSA